MRVRARPKAAKVGVGRIMATKEWGSQGYLATMKVLCPSEASRKIRNDLKKVPPRVCHVPLSLKTGDVMSANEATKGSPARRNSRKT